MRIDLDPAIVEFAGSETRVLTLAVLANAERPMTGYRVAKTAGLAPIKVYGEIRRAEEAGTVRKTPEGFVLVDADLRSLLRKRVRRTWSWDWMAETDRRQAQYDAIAKRLEALPPPRFRRERGWRPRRPELFPRREDKDETLRRLGLQTSTHR